MCECSPYRRGLTGVAYPMDWAMREPESWGRQNRFPRFLFIYSFLNFISNTKTAVFGESSKPSNAEKSMHIGQLIKQKVEERHKTVVWLARELSCCRSNVYKIYEKSSIDTDILLRLSCILDYDFFSLYTEEVQKKKCPQ